MDKIYSTTLDRIEEEISKVLPTKTDKNWIYKAVGGLSSDITTESTDNINRPALELIYRGGKRWRPLVLVLTAACFNNDLEMAFKLSPFVELIHNGTLLIDDIEDKAIERRGKKAVHLIFGEDMAINSGNHLYYIPTTIIDNLDLTDKVKLNIYQSYTHNMRRLHFGQGLDIQWHNDLKKIPSVTEYIQMCKFKTGCLASMSGELGAICAGLSNEEIENIRTIWEEIGVGFQILDDIKNITTGNPGKHRGDDIVEGKKSLPVILYCNKNEHSKLLNNIKMAKLKGIIKGKKYVERAIKILDNSGAITEGSKIALELLNNNIGRLNSTLPNSPYKKVLINIVNDFIKKML
ncbi:MAG: polyprenyl synthetase family protein [Spirochaetaceae bacterium]